MNYDAFLLVSFGGPERMEDVLPFLENVLRGTNVPRKRMSGSLDRSAIGMYPANPHVCITDCCPAPVRPLVVSQGTAAASVLP
jgi:hypothetical protein